VKQSPVPTEARPSPSPKRRPKPPKADRDLWVFERQAFGLGYATVAGVDEAGMGPWAGPVVAAAVILRPFFHRDGIDDSKLLTAEQREDFYPTILQNAEAWAVGVIEVDEIDRVGVRRAGRMAMALALQRLRPRLDYLLVDGFVLPEALVPQLPIIKGDRRSISIMSAGIVAKVTRDRRMIWEGGRFPGYGFAAHKGYPTPEHLHALDRQGLCPLHRRSFITIRTRAELEAQALANTARD
jgi:ribonuclease HII